MDTVTTGTCLNLPIFNIIRVDRKDTLPRQMLVVISIIDLTPFLLDSKPAYNKIKKKNATLTNKKRMLNFAM